MYILKYVVVLCKSNYNWCCFLQVGHTTVAARHDLWESFKTVLAQKLPNIETFNEEVLESVFVEFTRKLCNTRIQEFVSSMKQQLATKKGVASTVEVNLRNTLLTHHTQLGAKFTAI